MKFRRPNQHFQIVAHRGLPEDYPENTIIAYPTCAHVTYRYVGN